jgi:hypothetical protein
MVKSSSPNAPSTLLIFLCPRTQAKTSESLTFVCTREKVHSKCTMLCTVHFITTLFSVANVSMCVIYQSNFIVFMYVTRISLYISPRYYPRFRITAVGLGTYFPVDTAAPLYMFINPKISRLTPIFWHFRIYSPLLIGFQCSSRNSNLSQPIYT